MLGFRTAIFGQSLFISSCLPTNRPVTSQNPRFWITSGCRRPDQSQTCRWQKPDCHGEYLRVWRAQLQLRERPSKSFSKQKESARAESGVCKRLTEAPAQINQTLHDLKQNCDCNKPTVTCLPRGTKLD